MLLAIVPKLALFLYPYEFEYIASGNNRNLNMSKDERWLGGGRMKVENMLAEGSQGVGLDARLS